MKVVLFCGGLGMRLREYSETIPKPMVNIGYRPILWHVMKYYAHYGHKDFILCLGYRADAIKNYFLNYNECASNDFVLSGGGKKLQLFNSDIHDWRITFADTGINSNIGQRLKAVEKYLEGEEEFLANYSDGLTDMPLPQQLEHFHQSGQDRQLSLRPAQPQLSHGVAGGGQWQPGLRNPCHQQRRGADQWRLFHFQEEDFRLHRRKRRAGERAFRQVDCRKAIDWLSL